MRRASFGALGVLLTVATATTFSQTGTAPATVTYVTAEEIQTVVKAPGGGDRMIKIADLGKYNIGVAVLRRGASKEGATLSGINHTRVTEVYYVVSGEGTLVTGSNVTNVRPLDQTSELVTTIVGPSNNATFVQPTQTRKIKTGDVVIIPAGVYHGMTEIADHIEYVSVRPDIDKLLPAGYVHPAVK